MRDVRQHPNEPFRRWFSDDNFDLIVWFKPDKTIYGFELTYDKTDHEKAIRWFANKALSHHNVDSGEQDPRANRTPILTPVSSQTGMGHVLSSFEAAQEGLPENLAALIKSKLRELGRLT